MPLSISACTIIMLATSGLLLREEEVFEAEARALDHEAVLYPGRKPLNMRQKVERVFGIDLVANRRGQQVEQHGRLLFAKQLLF